MNFINIRAQPDLTCETCGQNVLKHICTLFVDPPKNTDLGFSKRLHRKFTKVIYDSIGSITVICKICKQETYRHDDSKCDLFKD